MKKIPVSYLTLETPETLACLLVTVKVTYTARLSIARPISKHSHNIAIDIDIIGGIKGYVTSLFRDVVLVHVAHTT